MPQQKSTSFSAAKVANFGVVLAEMVEERLRLEKEVKRLQHHVSVLSKRNNQLMKEGKSREASSIASDASLSSDDEEVGTDYGEDEEKRVPRQRVVKSLVGEKAREKAHGDGVPAPWCTEGAEEWGKEHEERGLGLGRSKWKVAELEVAESVVAESVAKVKEAEVAEPKVRLPKYENGKGKRRRVGEKTEEEKEVEEVRELIAPLGPRAECGGLLRRVGRKSVFAGAEMGLVAGGRPNRAAPVGISRGLDARRQSPGARGGYQLRPSLGGIRDEWGRLCYGGRR